MIYELIATGPRELSVRRRCRSARVSPSSYYAWSRENKSTASTPDDLLEKIEQVLAEFTGYGYRRVAKELKRRGTLVNKKRVQRIMQEHRLQRRLRRRYIRTTESNHGFAIYPNLLPSSNATGPDQVWAADITYVRLVRSFVYVSILMDLFSRKVIGWALSNTLHASVSVEALTMALNTRKLQPGIIHHSDRGVQYACTEYIAILQAHGFTISMSRKGNPYDNAKLESFMKTLKIEEVYLNEYETEHEARQNIGRFIEEIYNQKRLHSSLGYVSPVKFEDEYYSQRAA